MSDWDFGGAFVDTSQKLQTQDQERQLFPLKYAREKALLDAAPADLQHLLATTRLNNANASLMERRAESQRQMAETMQGMKIGENGESESASVMKMAGAAMRAGDSTTAQSLILHASQMRTQETRESHYRALEAASEATRKMKLADRYAQLMNGVKSQEDFDRANFLFESEFAEPAPQVDYDPRTIDLLRESAVKMRDKAYADHLKVQERLGQARLGETQKFHSETLKLRQAAENRRVEAQKQREKNGGKDVGAPSRDEVAEAGDLLAREGKAEGLDSASRRTASYDLAARARGLRKANPGLDAGEAQQRALNEQVAEGYYTTKKATTLLGIPLGKDKNLYGKPGGHADRALPVPADRKTLKPNTYYKTPKGSLMYLGNGQWQAPTPASSGGGGAEEDEDEE